MSLALLIPAYNAAGHLPRLLRSAAEQTKPFDEIWVHDDASIDDTARVAEQWGARVVRADTNRGCSAGKNELARRTSCDWVHFHDADDELLPAFVERAQPWMERPEADVVLFGYEERHVTDPRHFGRRVYDDEALQRDPVLYAIRTKIVSICGIYRRRRFAEVGGYDLDPLVLYNEDVALHCRLALNGLPMRAAPDVTVVNWIQTSSMSSSNAVRCLQAHYEVMRRMAEATGRTYSAAIADRLWLTAAAAASHLDWKTADAAAALAVDLNGSRPSDGSPLFRALCHAGAPFALRARELLLRLLRPELRRGYPRPFRWLPSRRAGG